MEIKIDTNKDSKEHIRHMIDFLQRFVGSQQAAQGLFSETSSEPAPTGVMGMFGDDAPAPSASEEPKTPEDAQKLSLEPY